MKGSQPSFGEGSYEPSSMKGWLRAVALNHDYDFNWLDLDNHMSDGDEINTVDSSFVEFSTVKAVINISPKVVDIYMS